MGAAPGRALHDLGLPLGRDALQGLFQIDELHVAPAHQLAHRRRQDLVPALLVVAQRLAVEGHRQDLVVAAPGVEPAQQPSDELGRRAERVAEGQVAGDVAVVEEDHQLAALDPHPVRAGGVEARAARVLPLAAGRADPQRLVGREDGEADALGDQVRQRRGVGCGLRQPESAGRPVEAASEIRDAPAHLRAPVPCVGERQDGVRVALRDGVPLSPRLGAALVRLDDAGVDLGPGPLQPGQQGRAEVERQVKVVVDDVEDPVLRPLEAGGAIGAVALRGDATVPVVEWLGAVLDLDGLDPRVLAGRLVEMAVKAEQSARHAAILAGGSPADTWAGCGGKALARQVDPVSPPPAATG